MSEQQFGWNYFENEVVIRDKQDKKRMIVIVFSNFMCIPYNRKSFDELVDLLNELNDENKELKKENEQLKKRLYLYERSEDEVDKYLRTHPMPTIANGITITTPLDMRHRW